MDRAAQKRKRKAENRIAYAKSTYRAESVIYISLILMGLFFIFLGPYQLKTAEQNLLQATYHEGSVVSCERVVSSNYRSGRSISYNIILQTSNERLKITVSSILVKHLWLDNWTIPEGELISVGVYPTRKNLGICALKSSTLSFAEDGYMQAMRGNMSVGFLLGASCVIMGGVLFVSARQKYMKKRQRF